MKNLHSCCLLVNLALNAICKLVCFPVKSVSWFQNHHLFYAILCLLVNSANVVHFFLA